MNGDPLIMEIIISSIITFIINVYATYKWIDIAKLIGFLAEDRNKPGYPKAVVSGGTWTLITISMGLLVLEIIRLYLHGQEFYLASILALSFVAALSTLLGLIDDLLSYLPGRQAKTSDDEGAGKGLSAKTRILLMLPISIPLVAIKAGYTKLDLIRRVIDLGIYYPLVVVPIGVMAAAMAFNMLAGYNGLEAGMGVILLLGALGVGLIKGNPLLIAGAVVGIAGILAFLVFNWYPAKAFPGNSFTYGVGAYYAGLVVLGNFEKYAVLSFMLYYMELFFYLKSLWHRVKKVNFAYPCPDGSLTLDPRNENKIYSVTHLALKILLRLRGGRTQCPTGVRETHVVLFILGLQAVISASLFFLLMR